MKHYQNKESGQIVLAELVKIIYGYQFLISSNGKDFTEGHNSYIYLSKRHFKSIWQLKIN